MSPIGEAPAGETRKGGAAGTGARPGRARLWFWLRFAAVAALLWWVFHKNGRGRIMEALLSAAPGWVLLAGALFFLSILLGAWQWWLLLRLQGIEWGYRASFRTYYSGMFLNNFLPGTVGGDAMRVYEVRRSEAALGKAVAATFLDRLMGFFSLSLMSVIAMGIILWKGTLDQNLFRHLLYAVGVVFACFVVVLALLLSRRLSSVFQDIIGWTGMKWLEDAFGKVQETLQAYHARRRQMAGIVLVSLAVQVLRVAVHSVASIALGMQVAPAFFFTFIPIIALVAILPFNLGGWGLPQSLGTYLYTLPGVIALAPGDPKVAAAALAFLPSVVGLVVMLGGGFYFVSGKPGQKEARMET